MINTQKDKQKKAKWKAVVPGKDKSHKHQKGTYYFRADTIVWMAEIKKPK